MGVYFVALATNLGYGLMLQEAICKHDILSNITGLLHTLIE